MRIIKSFALVLVLHFAAHPAWGLTVDETVRTALERNPELQALRLEADAAKGQLDKARLPLIANPTLEGFGSRKERSPEEGSGRVTNYGMKLSQEFEIAGQKGVRVDVALRNLARIDLEIKDRERMVGYEAKRAYAQALAFKERVSLTEEVVRLREDLLNLTRAKYQAGDVSALEVNLAEVEASKTKSDLVSAQQAFQDAMFVLQGVMGGGAEGLPSVEGQLTPDAIAIPDKESLRNALAERPDIKAAAVEVDRSDRATELVRREAVPNPSIGAFYNRDEMKSDIGVALTISLPLFDRKQGERREARARLEQSRIRRSGLALTVEREFEHAYTNLVSSMRQVSLYQREIIAKSLENLGLLNLAFKEGKIGFLDVRLAQRDAIDLRFAHLDALLRAQQAIYAMERTTGGSLK